MNTFVKIIFYFGFLFWGGGFLVSLLQYFAYNGFGNVFEYKKADYFCISNDTTSMPAKLTYEYIVDERKYKDYQNVSTETAKLENTTQFTVLYNVSFNNFSIIKELKGRETKTWDQTVGMIIFGFFFLFIFLIYKFADMDKWIGVYTRGEYKSSKKKSNQ
jgi:hypothetical protein